MKTLLQLSQGHNIAVSVLQNLEPEERLSVSSFIQNDFQTSIFLINHVSPIKSTLCRMSSDIILPFVKSTTLILVQTVTAGAWHLVTKYKLSSQVLGSLLAGFWLLLLLLNPRPTSGWKQTNKYKHGSCVLLVHWFFIILTILCRHGSGSWVNWACKLNVVALGGSLLALKFAFYLSTIRYFWFSYC